MNKVTIAGTLILTLCLISPLHAEDSESGQEVETVEQAQQKLDSFSQKAKNIWPYIDHQVAIGFPEPTLLQLSEDEENALLVIHAFNEPSTFNEWFGTYETRVAEGANCPVLVVPKNMPWQQPVKLLYIMDMSDAKVENMRILAKQAKALKADLQVIVIAEEEIAESDDTFQLTVNIFRNLLGYKEATFHRIFGKKRSAQVQDLIEALQPDWFAFEQKNKNFLERIIDDYNTKRLLLESDIPVLVF